jgi:hypothetical protein
VDDEVELFRDQRLEVVREPLRLGSVDDADRALKALSLERARLDQEARHPGVVEEPLPAVRTRRPDVLALGHSSPVRGGRDGPRESRKAPDERLVAVAPAHQLADVELSPPAVGFANSGGFVFVDESAEQIASA